MKILIIGLLIFTALGCIAGPPPGPVHTIPNPTLWQWLKEEFAYRDHDKDGSLFDGKRRIMWAPCDGTAYAAAVDHNKAGACLQPHWK